MADRCLGEARHACDQRRQVVQVQVVPGVDHQAAIRRGPGASSRRRRSQASYVARAERRGVGAGVDLDAIGAARGDPVQHRRVGIDEQDHPGAHRLQRRDGAVGPAPSAPGPSFHPSSEVKASGCIRHQRALLRAHLGRDLEQARVGIALDVQLHLRSPLPQSSRRASARRSGGCAARRGADAR